METKITKKCDVCGAEIVTHEYGGVKCKNCGWIDDVHQAEYPACANANNLISLERARDLWKQGKKLLPDFKEAVSLIERGFDLSIKYKKQTYLITCYKSGKIEIENQKSNSVTSYKNISDFIENAKINEELLSAIWEKIDNIEYGF